MTISDYNIFTLPNGMRVVHRQTDSHVGYSGVVIRAGSRDEGSGLHGLAHFVEHTIFKGTAHRSSWHINNRLESIGGELNAYTTKEETLLFANTPAGNTERAFELLYDLIAYCNFPHAEIERERDVVIEEINSYLDNPGDSAFDEFEDRIYAGSGLGHNILGTPESVRMLNSEDCRAFIDRLYRPEDMVLYCADPATPSKVEKLAFKHFGRLHHPGSGTDAGTAGRDVLGDHRPQRTSGTHPYRDTVVRTRRPKKPRAFPAQQPYRRPRHEFSSQPGTT